MGQGRSPREFPDDKSRYSDYDYELQGDDDLNSPEGRSLEEYGEFGGLGGQFTGAEGALMPYDQPGVPALANGQESGPVLIPGSGVSMGTPFIKRRERPLTMRLAIVTLMGCLLVTGLLTVQPLSAAAEGGGNAFQILSGAVVLQSQPSYFWYTVKSGDNIESIAAKFNVQIGGIYELNNMLSGQDITIGKAYKIPDDPNYGANYRPPTYVPPSSGSNVFGDSPWTTISGYNGAPEALCDPDNGYGNPTGYDLVAPNPNSFWVRGFSWYHDGVDISTVAGNPIHAAQAGEVIWAGWDVGGLGYSIKINNCWGISTVYGHMETLLAKVGDSVEAGQTIGLEGSTGWSTGPHLHFMVEVNNVPVDPSAYFGYDCDAITGSNHYGGGASCD
ncbi:MAG: LysM peptidoglycan-binding domain-containing M23 family metallopeptidase [Ktedonobacterales bacterium]